MKGETTMRFPGGGVAAIGSMTVLLAAVAAAHAIRPDECEQQRALYPAVWADVSREQPLFDCASHYAGSLRIKLGPTDASGRTWRRGCNASPSGTASSLPRARG